MALNLPKEGRWVRIHGKPVFLKPTQKAKEFEQRGLSGHIWDEKEKRMKAIFQKEGIHKALGVKNLDEKSGLIKKLGLSKGEKASIKEMEKSGEYSDKDIAGIKKKGSMTAYILEKTYKAHMDKHANFFDKLGFGNGQWGDVNEPIDYWVPPKDKKSTSSTRIAYEVKGWLEGASGGEKESFGYKVSTRQGKDDGKVKDKFDAAKKEGYKLHTLAIVWHCDRDSKGNPKRLPNGLIKGLKPAYVVRREGYKAWRLGAMLKPEKGSGGKEGELLYVSPEMEKDFQDSMKLTQEKQK